MQQDIETFIPSPGSGSNRSGYLTITADHRDYEVRLSVVGELDLATQELLARAAADVLQPPVRALLLGANPAATPGNNAAERGANKPAEDSAGE